MKIKCKKCNKIKNITEFHKNKNYKIGYRRICKKCVLIESKKYYKKHKKERKLYANNYRQTHKEERRVYLQKNQKRISKRYKEYYQRNYEYSINRVRKYYKTHHIERIIYNKKYRKNFSNGYVRQNIKLKYNIPLELISDDMIQRERELMQINHVLRKEKQNGYSKKINRSRKSGTSQAVAS